MEGTSDAVWNMLGCDSWDGGPLAPDEWRPGPGMPPHSPAMPWTTSHVRELPALNVNSAKAEQL